MLRILCRAPVRFPGLVRTLRGLPPEVAPSLEQRLEAMNPWDAETEARVDIGFYKHEWRSKKQQEETHKEWKLWKRNRAQIVAAKEGKLRMDYDVQKEEWTKGTFSVQMKTTADHYGIYQDLFEYGYFYPTTYLKVSYPINEEEVAPVHMGNIMDASETVSVPEVFYEAEPDEMFTLVMTSLDGHLQTTDKEYLHWMVSNIPGNDVSKGTVVCDYMRPVVPKGAGYHRFAFVLYKHMNGKLDLSEEQRKPNTTSLLERTFKTLDFYRKQQDFITPCGLSFFQCKFDDSLVEFFHKTLDMKVPVFEHIPLEEPKLKFNKWPEDESFNEYIDLFRDKKEIAEEIYCKRLKKLDPFQDEPADPKYPHVYKMPRDIPSWYKTEVHRERAKQGKYRHLRRFSLYDGMEDPRVKPFDRYGPQD